MKFKYANFDFKPKEINEERKSLRATFSTSDVDRHGEIVDQKSWNLTDYLKNPVVLFSHRHDQPPVGKIVGLGYNSDGNLEGEVQFAANEYPFANTIWNLYKGGYMKAFSVGFSAGNSDVVDGRVVLKDNTLYEISTVSVPANALALAKSKGLDTSALEEKFLEIGDDTVDVSEKDCPCNKKPDENAEVAPTTEETAEEDSPEKEVSAKSESSDSGNACETISEVLSEEDARKAKYENFKRVDQLYYAFYEVYFESETPVDEFDTLLQEYISLLGGGDTKSKIANKSIEDISDVMIEKAGRVLSAANRTKLEAAVAALQAVLDADNKEAPASTDTGKKSIPTTFSLPVIDMKGRCGGPKKPKKAISNKKINKAIRALLKAKKNK